ncbi:MAG: hypothetical protein KGM49_00440 [Sphingomonadales bacterium]|nr:hypothetical protein [Sphingomonadales bacterium]
MSRTAQRARLDAYAAKEIAAKAWGKPSLRAMIERAAAASDNLLALQGMGDAISDAQYCRADEAAYEARAALLDHLFTEHGVGRALARKLGDVL